MSLIASINVGGIKLVKKAVNDPCYGRHGTLPLCTRCFVSGSCAALARKARRH